MKTRFVLLILFIVVLNLLPVQSQDVVTTLLGRINTLRSEQGLAPYTLHPALIAAAQNQAQWMVDTGQVDHVQPDGSRPRDRAVAAGYSSSWVSENIYMGGLATADSAWDFWLHSPIHYAGLTNANYQQIGIATAQGASGQSFVLVFGAPGGASPNNGNSSGTGNTSDNDAPAAPPSYVVGVDAVGNIMHQIQPGDTIGAILLRYGYSWDDQPLLLAMNNMSEEDIYSLVVGEIILVPPKSGTYTPTPANEVLPEATEDLSQSPISEPTLSNGLLAPATFVLSSATNIPPSPTMTPQPTTLRPSATQTMTRAMIVSTLPIATSNATSIPANADPGTSQASTWSRPPLWLIGAIFFQIGILGYASFEYIRRNRKTDE